MAEGHRCVTEARLDATKEAEGRVSGGEEGIRTPGTREGSTVFKTAAIDHSATSPRFLFYLLVLRLE